MIEPRDFLKQVIATWEGLYSDDADDSGNWANGRLLGSMHGVTPEVLARHRGISVDALTPITMRSVTLDEAADIGMEQFYKAPHFDLLAWAPSTAALVDFGWGSGSGQAVKSMQRIVGANADGALGPMTAKAYNDWLAGKSNTDAAQAIYDMRVAFYREIARVNPVLQKYLKGWINRAQWALNTGA